MDNTTAQVFKEYNDLIKEVYIIQNELITKILQEEQNDTLQAQ